MPDERQEAENTPSHVGSPTRTLEYGPHTLASDRASPLVHQCADLVRRVFLVHAKLKEKPPEKTAIG